MSSVQPPTMTDHRAGPVEDSAGYSLSRRSLLSTSMAVAISQLLPFWVVKSADARVDIDIERFGDKGMLFCSSFLVLLFSSIVIHC